MADQDACDAYSMEMARRFEELTRWAIQHWPSGEYPLLESDFDASRREIQSILGEKLTQACSAAQPPGAGSEAQQHTIKEKLREPSEGGEQYVSINPAPWP